MKNSTDSLVTALFCPLSKARLLCCTILALITISSPAQTLLLRYSFDESNSGTTDALDSGAAPLASGTFLGAATRTANTPNNFSTGALDLSASGLGDYVSGGDVDKVSNLPQMTITGWLNMQGAPSFADRIFSKSVVGPLGIDWSISVGASPLFKMNLVIGTASGFTIASTLADINADHRWIFTAITYDATQVSSNVIFYIGDETNAAAFHAAADQDRGPAPLNDGDLRVGSTGASGADRTPTAWIDDIRVYSGILSPSQIDAVRQSNLSVQTTPPQAVQIINPIRNGNGITFSFLTQNSHTHIVQYKNSLTQTNWQDLLTIPGNGSITNISDTAATTRFFRVATQ